MQKYNPLGKQTLDKMLDGKTIYLVYSPLVKNDYTMRDTENTVSQIYSKHPI